MTYKSVYPRQEGFRSHPTKKSGHRFGDLKGQLREIRINRVLDNRQ